MSSLKNFNYLQSLKLIGIFNGYVTIKYDDLMPDNKSKKMKIIFDDFFHLEKNLFFFHKKCDGKVSLNSF